MALHSRDLQPYSLSVRARRNLHVDHQDRKPMVPPSASVAYVVEVGTPVVFDVSAAAWKVCDGNAAGTDHDLATLRGFIAEEHTFQAGTDTELALVMLRGKMTYEDIPIKTDGSLSLYDADGGNELAIATESELIAMLQGVAPGGGAVPETTLRELGIYVSDVPNIA